MIIASIDLFAAFVAVGLIVVLLPDSHYDIHGARLRGTATTLAVVLTDSGRWPALTAIAVVLAVLFGVMRWPLWIPAVVALSQVTSQAVIEGVKRLFRRLRPGDWLGRAEHGYSYPSGHSSTAVTFFCAWALVAWYSPLPHVARVALAAFLVLWAIGIAWSRLALAAHFLTDVIGGWLFGSAWLCLMLTIAMHAKGPAFLPGLR